MKHYVLEPEVSGGLGASSELDTSCHPPIVRKLEYVFDGWQGDSLIESFPCFIVTAELGERMLQQQLTGFSLADVIVTRSIEFNELGKHDDLPNFRWLQPSGLAGINDIALGTDFRLVVSERALALLRSHGIDHCQVEPIA